MAAYLIGRDDEYLRTLERAYNAHRGRRPMRRAVRCAFWLGFRLLMRGEMGRATGWFARAQRLLERDARECAERGYLLLPVVEQRLESGDFETAYATAADAAAIGERCGDADLIACARHQQGRIRLQQGQVEAGLALLDETMVTVTAGELSPLVTGLMYCSVIEACQQVYALDRSREWTAALRRWCEGQPDMVAFAGVCQVHRAEIMQLQGAWPEAIEEARRACARSQGVDRQAAAAALYQQAEVHRLKGEFAAAEEAYRGASQLGLEPQPGLALLRLVQGRSDAAATAIRRVASTTTDRLKRMSLLPAYVEIMLAAGDVEDARNACRELEEIAELRYGGAGCDCRAGVRSGGPGRRRRAGRARRAAPRLRGVAADRGALRRRARARADRTGLPRPRGRGRRRLEIAAARSVFERLGATPDLARIDALMKGAPSGQSHGLTPRELQVLRLVASRRNQQGHRQQAIPEREDDRPARQQHLRQARRVLASRGDGLRLPAQAHLTRRSCRLRLGEITHAIPRRELGCSPKRGLHLLS